ncbi:unannotated protein [freshwater metagenome]|uniref:Unannotated protein n=1 Tax=freshwater metagenome TaxID=449393 RepID=A0A6J6D4C9_9ZZZZ
MRAQALQVSGENLVRTHEAFDAHRRGDVGNRQKVVEVVNCEAELPEHPIRSVDECKALFFLQSNSRYARHLKSTCCGHFNTVRVTHITFADERQRAV